MRCPKCEADWPLTSKWCPGCRSPLLHADQKPLTRMDTSQSAQKTNAAGTTLDQQGDNRSSAGNSPGDLSTPKQQAPLQPTGEDHSTAGCHQGPTASSAASHPYIDTTASAKPSSHYEGSREGAGVSQTKESQSTVLSSKGAAQASFQEDGSMFPVTGDGNPNGEAAGIAVAPNEMDEFTSLARNRMSRIPSGEQHHSHDNITQAQRQTSVENSIRSSAHPGGQQKTIRGIQADPDDSNKANRSMGTPESERTARGSPDTQLKGQATQQLAFDHTSEQSQASYLSGKQQQSQGKQVDSVADLPKGDDSDRMSDAASGSDKTEAAKSTNEVSPYNRTLNGSKGVVGPKQQSKGSQVDPQSLRSQNSPTDQTSQSTKRFQEKNKEDFPRQETMEHTTAVSSPQGGKESTSQHPLKTPQDTVPGGGFFYNKENFQKDDFANGAKSKKQLKKEEKERKKAEKNAQSQISPHPTLQQVPREQGVTVIFHVFLVSNFKPEEVNMFIRADGVDLGDFVQNCVDMHLVDDGKTVDKERLVRFRGELTLTLDRAKRGTYYKYVVVKKGNVYWEELVEFPSRYGQIVNRFLGIPDNYIKPNAIWEQFDAVSYVYGDQSLYEKLKGLFSKEKTVPNRTDALLCCLPKWKGFFVGESGDNMTASDALDELIRIAQAFSSVWVKDEGQSHSKKRPPDFDIRKALYDFLKPKMEENIQVLSQSKVGSSAYVSALVSSLAISVVVDKYAIALEKNEVGYLLKCLALEADSTEKKCTVYEAVLAQFSEEFRGSAVQAIERLCNQFMDDAWNFNPEWLFAVPLLHFLRQDSKPFQEPDFEGLYKTLGWWGAQKLKISKIPKTDKQDYSTVWPQLVPAFEVDRLLKRTYLRTIPVFDLDKAASSGVFNVSDLCVALFTFFPEGCLMEVEYDKLMECMKSMISLLEPKETTTSVNIESVDFTVSTTLTLAKTCLTKLSFRDHADLICLTIKLFFASIQKRRFVLSNTEAKGNRLRELLEKLEKKLGNDLDNRMPDHYSSGKLLWELEVWSKLLRVVDVNQGFDEYRDSLTDQLSRRAKKVEGKYLVEIFCEVNLDGYDRAVGESFTKLAFEAVEKIINSQRGEDVDHTFKTLATSSQRHQGAEKYGGLLSMLLTKSWPRATEGAPQTGLDPRAVEFLLTWNPMKGYLKFFDEKSGRGVILTPEGQETLLLATSLLDEIKRLISDASITVRFLTLLHSNQQRFLDLLETMPNEDNTKRCLADRIEEIQEFQKTKKQVYSFIRMCDLIQPVNMSNVKSEASLDLSSRKISDLCRRLENNKVEVTFFQLPAQIKEILPQLQNVQDSSIFQELWTKLGKKAQKTGENGEAKKAHLSLSDVFNQVWTPTFKAWSELVIRVRDGSATLREVDKHFGGFKERTKELKEELNTVFSLVPGLPSGGSSALQKKIQERADQIQRYQQLHQYAGASDTIWDFKEAMGFNGDFQVIEDLRNQLSEEFKQKVLGSIGEQFAKAGKTLDCLTTEKVECFKTVVKSKRLIEWLRTTIKSTQELKVLVDLALISAGESDIETDRISNLHTSCLQFAPLIFDLRETEERKVNFDDLAKACDPVWKAVAADRTLPQKLYDTSLHLEWLKTIKDSHGSVAMTSLVQAEFINSRGVYTVGRLETGDGSFADQERELLLNSVIKLNVPPKDGDEETEGKEYSLDELTDLQSKLMLIAGKASKGKDQVDAFVKNLEGVMRLATAYVNLSKSGFVHRLDWNQSFDCSKDRLEGESIIRELAEASTVMEKCFDNWKRNVSDTRKEFKELNFFSTQQLIVLRRELAAACHSNDLQVNNLQVLTLLESVRPNLEAEHVKAAILRAFKDSDILEKQRVLDLPSFTATPSQSDLAASKSILNSNNYLCSGSSNEIQTISVKKSKPVATSKIRSFLDAAEDAGHPEKLAIAALASLGVDSEEDDLLLWCLENADEENIDELYEEGLQNADIANELCPVDDEREKKSLEEFLPGQDKEESKSGSELGASQTLLMGLPQSTAAAMDCLPDDSETEIGQYLTLLQLGSVLRELALKGKGARDRTFPSYLKRGRPNLMLVPKDDVLATVLALYMYDKPQPLPSSDEVLICTPETTTEEVELLWRRATGDFQGRFYCLVNADQLNFTVSKEAVIKLSVLTQGLAGKAGEHYGLVVICSSEKEHRANIVAALDQFRVAAPPCPSPKDIKGYLKQKFLAPRPQYGYVNGSKITWTAAGSLDPENLSVRVVSSNRGGLGKSLYVRRLGEKLPDITNNDLVVTSARRCGSEIPLHVTVPLHGNSTDASMVIESLLSHAVKASTPVSRIFHLDISPAMRRGLDTLLFSLLVLGALCDQTGRVWRRRCTDLYLIEVTTTAPLPTGLSKEEQHDIQENQSGKSIVSKRPFYDLLPNVTCSTPKTVSCTLATTQRDPTSLDPLFDLKEFRSAQYQRAFQYLKLSNEGKSLDNFTFVPGNVDDDQLTCLNLLLRYCGVPNPSWSEVRHFVSFLNSQLCDCELSVFCNMELMRDVLAGSDVLNLDGFRTFVVRFMIQMSRDFATPSLTDENTLFYTEDNEDLERREIEQFVLRRSWESSPHPYLFFNQDHITMTFLGFFINNAGDLVDPRTKRVLEKNVMSKALWNGLQAQRVDFTTDTDTWTKEDKISKLCSVMGVKTVHDPDQVYELTTDNVKKILAIHMRFRCNIPVIVMGETGCGKTRLIRYMCGLQSGVGGPRNMLLVKVHGGTTYEDIKTKVCQAEEMARQNQDKDIDTVLFFDEANTTEALSMIKEVMVDRRIEGRRIGVGLRRLQFIAACNPYRRHTDAMIHKLESAGLGYHVKTDESEDRLGHIPLRHLVYRVHALPGSIRPLIWDFGQLNPDVEELYTKQIVNRYILQERNIPGDPLTVQSITAVLAASQKYMRDQSDECSFVSLRDVERTMQLMVWFYERVDTLGRLMRRVLKEKRKEEGEDDEDEVTSDESDDEEEEAIDPITRALVLAIGVCYHAKLQGRRKDYRTVVAKSFGTPLTLSGGQRQILREITSCQQAVLNELELGPNIARNTALSENVFMMVVCIELRIPLFVVGKPGSSKSLAKTVVAGNMQGDAARSNVFKSFKQVHMASYQCSPLSTPEGIVATFRQCSKLQEGKNPDKFVSVVVLDEVGLAEDSPLMPLKTLHPLLEDGVTSTDDVIQTDEKSQRVAFIGISNWALDPAKMNRGIMLSRGVPDERELVDSAMGICSTDKQIRHWITPLLPPLAQGYAELYNEQSNFETLKKCGKEEFFGLRDFYSLIKMVYSMAAKLGHRPRWKHLEHAIKRNFGGLTKGEPVKIFKRHFPEEEDDEITESATTIRLIEASLKREDVADRENFSENRYLLILTENYAALRIMQQNLLKSADDAVVIFGSSFPSDQEYTQICRNINRIKVCMETGRTVILLNLESLYESLYDALNQYYVYLGGQKYVDLGLGTHRVKCRVHDDFKLIVIAEKEVVYNRFPIPLINRLEKHYLVMSTSLTPEQAALVEKLRTWANEFATVQGSKKRSRDFTVGDAFFGYHEDTVPSIVMQVCNDIEEENVHLEDGIPQDTWENEVLKRSQEILIAMAAPDAVVRLPATGLAGQARDIWDKYFNQQQHSSLAVFVSHILEADGVLLTKKRQEGLFIQITTHSRLLTSMDLAEISNETKFHRSTVECVTLQQFQTEQQFRVSVREFSERLGGYSGILLVQCDSGDENFNLIAGARHILMEERANAPENLNLSEIQPIHIVMVVQLPRVAGGCRNFVGFQGGKWLSNHIDELRPPGKHAPTIKQLIDRPISELFASDTDGYMANPKAHANAVDLLRICVQAAACRIDDDSGSSERSTHRIELLLNLLPDYSQEVRVSEAHFVAVLIRRTYQLLKERDEMAYQAGEWLHSEALSGTGVHEWGTFRKALWQRICTAVVPVLAELIALADRDGNLDLIGNDDSWVSVVWLKIFDNQNIAELHYNKIISPVTNVVRERVQVLGSGAGGHLYSCRFPFSCLIKERADKLLKVALGVAAQSNASVIDSFRDLLKTSELGPISDEIRCQNLASLTYLKDFFHMEYKPSFPEEDELVCEAILSSARELGAGEDDTGSDLVDIPLIHVAYSRIQSRLSCFSRIVQCLPGVLPQLSDLVRGKSKEVLFDVVALQICLEELTPSEEALLSPSLRRAWCEKVLALRPAVEEMMRKEKFGPATELTANYGEKSKTILKHCRSIWQRCGAVRLFVEHVTFTDPDMSDAPSENVLKLWKVLGEETDFLSVRSLQIIERFLISCSSDMQDREDEMAASEFRRRCNAFFMELVSIFCFGEATLNDLEPEALSMLMRYVIGHQSTQTKDFSPFPDYGIDPTPVVRSFLLQQLLRSSTKLVKEHLEVFLQEAQGLKPDAQHINEVCFLAVQCMEDALIGRHHTKMADSKLTVKIKYAKKTCDEAFKVLSSENESLGKMSVNALEAVAKGRYVLTVIADYIHKCFIERDTSWRDLDVQREMRTLLESAEQLCCKIPGGTPQLYLLKQLARRYGLDCVRTLGGYGEVEWILPAAARAQDEEVIQDRFIGYESSYRDVRNVVAKAIISGNLQDITTSLTSDVRDGVNKEAVLLLALYREVTLRNASVQQQVFSDEMKEKLNNFLQTEGQISMQNVAFAKQLVENTQGGQNSRLRIGRDKTPLEHTLVEIIIHSAIVVHCLGSGTLAEPLHLLMEDPAKMKTSYLPTMPEDNLLECIRAIQLTMQGTGWVGEWYECGHCNYPYFIGECTKPTDKGSCADCGKVIGGEDHKFLGEYRKSDRQDRTKTGHVLGDPGSRATVAEPQRNMSSLVCSLLRTILHAAMIMGASTNPQAISAMISPPINQTEATEVMWNHLQRDLDVLGRALGKSIDDAALTVHLVIQRMLTVCGMQATGCPDMQLQTRESRCTWEARFTSAVIVPVVENLDANLQKAIKLLMGDERFGRDPLVRQLYQFDEQLEDLSQGVSTMSLSLWRYRRQITIEQLGHSFQQETLSGHAGNYKVLGAFLKEEHKLRSVQFLPHVVRLQRLLMDRFHRRIDKEEAEKFTIRKFLQTLPKGPIKDEHSGLIQNYRNAWNSCRSFLGNQGRLRVPLDLCNTVMDLDCPIAMLLPTTRGMGVCATSLTFFLVNTHDEFLGTYRSATNQESPLERVSVSEVTASHLIAYDPEKDLMPLILANCNYSLELGQETLIQYNWATLERQLIDRFLRGRPFVDFKEERFAFSRDTRDDAVFASLKDKISQVPISRAIEGQIVAEFRSSLADICDVLSSLDIAIGFLASSGGGSDIPLSRYLHVVLRLPRERGLRSPTAEQHCLLSHTLALWRLMALERAKIMSRNRQEPFEQIRDVFMKKLSSSSLAHLNRVLRQIDMDAFLPSLLEMILLKIKQAGDEILTMSFQEYFDLYLAEKGLEPIPGTENIPDDVSMEHVKAVWNSAVQLADDYHKGNQPVVA